MAPSSESFASIEFKSRPMESGISRTPPSGHLNPRILGPTPRLEENVSMALDLDELHGNVLLGADPGILPLPALAEYLDSSTMETSSDRRRLESLYHERSSRPWLVFVFAWLALPFALRVDERGLIGGPAAAAVATLGAFFLVQSAGMTISRQGLLPTGLTPWLEIGLVLLGTAIALRRQAL